MINIEAKSLAFPTNVKAFTHLITHTNITIFETSSKQQITKMYPQKKNPKKQLTLRTR